MVDLLSFIPDTLKEQISEQLIDFLVGQAEKFASDSIAGKIRKFSSKAEFAEAVEKATQRGSERFLVEYADEDEDLVAAITADANFWRSKSVQQALLNLIKRPGAWTVE